MSCDAIQTGSRFPFGGGIGLFTQADQGRMGAGAEETDEVLVRGCLAQDDQSFARLVARYEKSVASILWHFSRDRLTLEELVQDTFVEAYLSLHRFRRGALLYPWLRTIATRVGYRYWRRLRRDRGRAALLAQQPLAAPRSPSDTADYVFRTLELLPPKDRLVLTLQYFEDADIREIAERMRWSVSATKVRAFRARKRLKALLLETEEAGQ